MTTLTATKSGTSIITGTDPAKNGFNLDGSGACTAPPPPSETCPDPVPSEAANLGYVAGIGYLFGPRSRAMFEFEHNMNRIVGQRFRAMLWLNVAVTK